MTPPQKSRKRQRDDNPEEVVPEVTLSDKAIEELANVDVSAFKEARGSKRQRVEKSRSLFVRSLPAGATSETLTEFFSQHYPVKHSTVVVDQKTKTSRGYGFVTFADADDAKDAKEKLDNVEWDGRKLRLDVAEPRVRGKDKDAEEKSAAEGEKAKRKAALEEARKPSKLIVRNLPWSVKKPQDLAKLFQSFGKVKYADLPNKNGTLRGFGFVTMRRRKHAEMALEKVNGKEVDGREIEVSWAVDKEIYDQEEGKEKKEEKERKEKKEKKEKSAAKEEDSESPKKKKKSTKEEKPAAEGTTSVEDDVAAFMAKHMGNMESEPESGDEDEDDEDEDEDEMDEDEDMDDDEDEGGVSIKPAKDPKKLTTDNSTTVFLRNLGYTVTDEQLKAFFTSFGPVRYARVVMDKATERPAGTGFVCFFNEEDCRACVKGAPRQENKPAASSGAKHSVLHDESLDPEGKYTLEGRLLQVSQAVSKDEVVKFSKDAEKKGSDKRRLFLLNEGVIDSSSPLHSLLAPSEIKMREASVAQRKKMVQGNPTLHLSLTRLAVRNIPRNATTKDLKELARRAIVGFAIDVKEGRRQPLSKEESARGGEEAKEAEHIRKLKHKGVVKQVKLIYETQGGNKVTFEDGAKSRGYGFIEYWSHRCALMGLRYLNGHQMEDDRGKKQRLIVEFAIENAQVVQRRKMLQDKSREKAAEVAKSGSAPAVNGSGGADRSERPFSRDGDRGHQRGGRAGGRGGRGGSRGGRDSSRGGSRGGRDGDRSGFRGDSGGQRGGRADRDGGKGGFMQSKSEKVEGRKDALQQTLIARKRMVRKKKAGARG